MPPSTPAKPAAPAINPLRAVTEQFLHTEKQLRLGGGVKAIERQHDKGRLTARERVEALLDNPNHFTELGLWAAFGMYEEFGGAPGAGVITGVGPVAGKRCMIIANDATVKAGAFFPMTCKKIIRAQMIAQMARLPLLYLVDSAGVFLPLQEDVFPDTDDFGRIFRNNAVLSAEGIPQIASIMGACVAGGGYLPVLCDTLIMTEGSGLYLAGPALVKAAIGQDVDSEDLGGAAMHAEISGTIDFKETDDPAALKRLRSLMEMQQAVPPDAPAPFDAAPPKREPNEIYSIFKSSGAEQYDTELLLECIVDAGAFDEYKQDYGRSIVCAYTRIEGRPCGVVANQRQLTQKKMPGGKAGPSTAVNMPAVIYDDSADKAARFIMDCNQRKIPIVFLHDTTGFMVGRDSEQGGIIRAGAKMVNAMANCVVPKISVILNSSYGAGNYAMCGRAFDPFLTLAWPGSRCAVMGAKQATGVLAMIEEGSRKRKGEVIDAQTHEQILTAIEASYTEQQDIRHGAARGWLDRIIQPHETRKELAEALAMAARWPMDREFRTGVLQT
ncbi:MAG: acyl-CoA carboxylase subunit beta [Phycisphaeraceae bacterium]|nr:acyl-CoA carboxylase subunit beta [Phycisphaeraceae bacterium]MCB9848053.1 acyl-CoA carboxylase subunit beta [Phycisphaeraceae bacterium]